MKKREVVSEVVEVGGQAFAELRYHVEAATLAMQKTCAHALCAGVRLIRLHNEQAYENGGDRRSVDFNVSRDTLKVGGDFSVSRDTLKVGGDFSVQCETLKVGGNLGVTHDTPSGFKAAIEAVGLNRRTAYRWMNATFCALVELGVDQEDVMACDVSHWGEWDKRLVDLAGRTSLRRLTLGAERAGTEDHRLETLIGKAEHGDQGAEELLEKVSEGKLTLVQAIRAAAGAEATKGKERRDPVYFALDMKTGELRGLFPRVLITMKNALLQWPSAGEAERRKAREAWKALVAELPAEFLK